jgi:hypothetical protein
MHASHCNANLYYGAVLLKVVSGTIHGNRSVLRPLLLFAVLDVSFVFLDFAMMARESRFIRFFSTLRASKWFHFPSILWAGAQDQHLPLCVIKEGKSMRHPTDAFVKPRRSA